MSKEREKQVWKWWVPLPWTITVLRLKTSETAWAVKVKVGKEADSVSGGVRTELLGLGLRFFEGDSWIVRGSLLGVHWSSSYSCYFSGNHIHIHIHIHGYCRCRLLPLLSSVQVQVPVGLRQEYRILWLLGWVSAGFVWAFFWLGIINLIFFFSQTFNGGAVGAFLMEPLRVSISLKTVYIRTHALDYYLTCIMSRINCLA